MTMKQWLDNCGCEHITDVKVTLGDPETRGKFSAREFVGCQYDQNGRTKIILIGIKPPVKRVASCYHMENRDWFVACHMLQDTFDHLTPEQKAKHHPYGPTFMLSPWDGRDEIDRYERIPMVIEDCPVTGAHP